MLLNILFLQHTAENCTGCFFCWALWMLLPLILGILMGKWIWGKYQVKVTKQNQEIRNLRSKFENAEKEFIQIKYQLEESEKDNQGLKASLADIQADKIALTAQLNRKLFTEEKTNPTNNITSSKQIETPNASLDDKSLDMNEENFNNKIKDSKGDNISESDIEEKKKSLKTTTTVINPIETKQESINTFSSQDFGKYFKNNNLQIIEGIGPKIESVLYKASYDNWDKIAAASLNELKDVLHDAGPRYRVHNPKTWSKQASFAVKGKWSELIEYQHVLNTAREDSYISNTLSKVEKLLAKKLGFVVISPDDLKIVEGIGPKIERVLKAAGINYWEDLSKYTAIQLKELLNNAGERYRLANPTSWPAQAKMAHRREWINLRAFQNTLNG